MPFDLFLITSLISVLASLVLFLAMLTRWRVPIARSFALFGFSTFLWQGLQLLGTLMVGDVNLRLAVWKLLLIFSSLSGLSLAALIFAYVGKKVPRLLVAIMILTELLYVFGILVTDQLVAGVGNVQTITSPIVFGPLGWLIALVHLLPFVYLSLVLLLLFIENATNQIRREILMVVSGVLLPVAILVATSFILPYFNIPSQRLTPLALVSVATVYLLAVSRWKDLLIRMGIKTRIMISYGAIALIVVVIVNITLAYALPNLFSESERTRLESQADLEERELVWNELYGNLIRLFNLMEMVGLLGSLVITVFVSRSIAQPIEDLNSKVRLVRSGNLSLSVATDSPDEVGELSRSLNDLIQKLRLEQASVTQKVAQQTSQLSTQIVETEKTKRALVNVLEDLYQEKISSEGLAADLKKFQLAVESASDHIIITDADGFIVYANPAAEKVTGFSRREIMGTKAGSLWGKRMPQQFYRNMWHTIKVEKKTFTGMINNRRKNGQDYIAESSITPILDNNGEVKFFVGIERDITKALEVDRMKTEFISLASHQMRTPLSAMRWFSELLLDGSSGPLSDEQRSYVESIAQSNERLIELVNSLLDISRIESGRLTIDPVPTDLGKLVSETLTTVEKQAKDKAITITVNVPSGLPQISVDPKLVSQVYLNLINNAIKYTNNEGKIIITLVDSDDHITSEIVDTGVGIPENQKHRVFERFFRGDNVMRTAPGGTGLGLYLAKQIVEASGGKIGFESKENVGTKFWFELPKKGSVPRKGEVTLTGAE